MPRLEHNKELFRNWESWCFLKVRAMSRVQTEIHVCKMHMNVCLDTTNEWDGRALP